MTALGQPVFSHFPVAKVDHLEIKRVLEGTIVILVFLSQITKELQKKKSTMLLSSRERSDSCC
jgi:hypothetical protein